MDFLETRVVDVCVDLRGRDARVAQHFLNLAQVGAASQQVRCERVAKRMRAEFRVAAG